MAVTKPGYMLEHPSIQRYESCETPVIGGNHDRENPFGADNQQETKVSEQQLESSGWFNASALNTAYVWISLLTHDESDGIEPASMPTFGSSIYHTYVVVP